MTNDMSRFNASLTPSGSEIDKSLLLVDDEVFSRTRLARALEQKGFDVIAVDTAQKGIEVARYAPRFAVIELRLGDGNGLDIVAAIRQWRADARVVMLTAYGNIATAVAAIKAGAIDYLPKPADPDEVEAALQAGDGKTLPLPPANPMSADRVKWEHIQRIYHQYGCNVSETARRLQMHRRTLQRILSKHAPKDNRSEAVQQMGA